MSKRTCLKIVRENIDLNDFYCARKHKKNYLRFQKKGIFNPLTDIEIISTNSMIKYDSKQLKQIAVVPSHFTRICKDLCLLLSDYNYRKNPENRFRIIEDKD